ncbi:hypothetical protein K3X13_01810 [Aliiroseovarius crassostreae]|uniref:hypothetical protein n=1 Tax=Aliiroseovarius crassostreae TaxID=154981 RepID=UPI002209D7EB|nr:hypothetical protein [Aliiroseovarius crassostreae]UWP92625.1 hypothetical protein K3X13_01810 [Aliiroseovarius crassostreae]
MHLKTVFSRLRTPSDFPDDWYAWATNQSGHIYLIGFPLGALTAAIDIPLWAAFPAIFGVYYLVWEVGVQRNPDKWDRVTDTFFVAIGGTTAMAIWQHAAITPVLITCQLVVLYLGVSNRLSATEAEGTEQ